MVYRSKLHLPNSNDLLFTAVKAQGSGDLSMIDVLLFYSPLH